MSEQNKAPPAARIIAWCLFILSAGFISQDVLDDYFHSLIWFHWKTLPPEFILFWDFWRSLCIWPAVFILTIPFSIVAIWLNLKIRWITKTKPIELIFVSAICLFLLGLITPTCKWSARAGYRQYISKVNMWAIHNSMLRYQDDHGEFPKNLRELYPKYVNDLGIFRPPNELSYSPDGASIERGYAYFPAAYGRKDAVLLVERPYMNHFEGNFVMFSDGRIEWKDDNEVRKFLADGNSSPLSP